MAEELTAVERALAEASAARDALVAHDAGAALLALFEQVARARKGVAICQAPRATACARCATSGCARMVFQQVRANDTIVQCDSCQRILYYVPPPPLATPPVTHAP